MLKTTINIVWEFKDKTIETEYYVNDPLIESRVITKYVNNCIKEEVINLTDEAHERLSITSDAWNAFFLRNF